MRKYLIDSLLARFSEEERRTILKDLCKVLGKSAKTIYRKRKALHGDSENLSSDELQKIAAYFNTNYKMGLTINDLVTPQNQAV